MAEGYLYMIKRRVIQTTVSANCETKTHQGFQPSLLSQKLKVVSAKWHKMPYRNVRKP